MLTKYNLVHEISKNIPTNVKMGEKKIIVGCSGGPDSTFLLRVLLETISLAKSKPDIIILSSLLREFANNLEELLGKISNDDIFKNLFSSFCIGK